MVLMNTVFIMKQMIINYGLLRCLFMQLTFILHLTKSQIRALFVQLKKKFILMKLVIVILLVLLLKLALIVSLVANL